MDSNTPKVIEQFLKENFHNKEFKKRYQEEKTEFIKGLEAEIGDELRTRINEIKGRFILLVGKSVEASDEAGRYAYCIKGHSRLNSYSFSGKTDERIENILNAPEYHDGEDRPRDGNIVDCLTSGGAVFLADLECHDRPLLKRLAEGIRNVKYGNNDKGLLIISTTNDRDSVPEYFKELFEVEVIELEPEKQGRIENITQGKPKSEVVIYNWSTNEDKQEVYCNGKLIAKLSDKPFKLYRCLYKKLDKFVTNETLKKAVGYSHAGYYRTLVDTMIKLKNILKKGLEKENMEIKGDVIETQKNGKKQNIAYKLLT